jgi:hypothetical protein
LFRSRGPVTEDRLFNFEDSLYHYDMTVLI